MTLLLKRKFLVLMAKLIKTLEARLIRSPTSYVAKIGLGSNVFLQAGNDTNGKPERLEFEVTHNPVRYSCASEMIAAVDLEKLVPGATSEEALHAYWQMATTRWQEMDTNQTLDRQDSARARKLCKGNRPAAMEAGLRKMGVRPPTYSLAPMLATLVKLVAAGSKVGMRERHSGCESAP